MSDMPQVADQVVPTESPHSDQIRHNVDFAPPAIPQEVPPAPTFDFSQMSWGESKRAAAIGDRLKKAQTSNDPVMFETSFNELQAYISKALTGVPREWLVSDAPADINWRDGASIDFLQSRRFASLVAAFNAAQALDVASGG